MTLLQKQFDQTLVALYQMEKGPKKSGISQELQTTTSDHVVVNRYDVLCGRGKIPYNHAGNKLFRKVIGENVANFSNCVFASERTRIVQLVIDAIHAMGGRFLKKSHENGDKWIEATTQQYRDKVAHAIRDASKQLLDDKKKQLSMSIPFAPASHVNSSCSIIPDASHQQTRHHASISSSSMLLQGDMSDPPFMIDQSQTNSQMAMLDANRPFIFSNDAHVQYLQDNQLRNIHDESSGRLQRAFRSRTDFKPISTAETTSYVASVKKEASPWKTTSRHSTKSVVDISDFMVASTSLNRKKSCDEDDNDNDDSDSSAGDSFVQQIDDVLGPMKPGT